MSGHQHADAMEMVDGVPHITMPSATYYWFSNPTQLSEDFTEEQKAAATHYRNMAFPRDPLWAVVEVDTKYKTVRVDGESSVWRGKRPAECGTISVDESLIPPYASNRYIMTDESQGLS